MRRLKEEAMSKEDWIGLSLFILVGVGAFIYFYTHPRQSFEPNYPQMQFTATHEMYMVPGCCNEHTCWLPRKDGRCWIADAKPLFPSSDAVAAPPKSP